jgi:hypothetical protein
MGCGMTRSGDVAFKSPESACADPRSVNFNHEPRSPPRGITNTQLIDPKLTRVSSPSASRSDCGQKSILRFVARQPCLLCGRAPAQAHHIRYAQSRGLGIKVSDEFTVPLSAIHHRENHATGDEKRWWQERKIDPLVVAEQHRLKDALKSANPVGPPSASPSPTRVR